MRPYDNTGRQLAAAETKARVVRAAGERFGADGYAATSLHDVARTAGVSVETVKKAFGTKPGVLRAWFDGLVAGEEAVPVAEQSYLGELSRSESLPDRTRIAAGALARTHRRVAPAYRTVAAATHADPSIATWWQQERRRRMQDVRTVVDLVLADHDPPRPAEQLVAELYALSEPHVYLVLTEELGWTDEQYTEWFARTALAAMTTPAQPTRHDQGAPS